MTVMSRKWMVAALTLAVAVSGRVGRADDDEIQAAVQSEYDRIARAYKTQTLEEAVEVRLSIEAEEFTNKERDKTYTREEYDASARAGVKELAKSEFKVTDYTNTIEEIAVEEDKTEVIVTTVIKCTLRKDGEIVPATITARTRNIWIVEDDEWKLLLMETVPLQEK